jgi:hypothetical protein
MLACLAWMAVLALGGSARAGFLVSSSNSNQVLQYTDTGAFVGVFAQGGGLSSPQGLAFGPNGDLYVASFDTGQVLEYNGQTGAFVKVFATSPTLTDSVIGLHLGPDNNLYVSEYNSGAGQPAIEKFNGTTGASLGTVVPFGAGGLSGQLDFSFDKTGSIYVSSSNTNQVLEYSPSGTFLGVFIAGNGLNFPDGQSRDAADDTYVSSSFSDQVLKFDAAGQFLGVAASLSPNSSPVGNLLESNGHLLVSANFRDQVQIFDSSGSLLGTTVGGGLASPTYLVEVANAAVPEPSSFVLAGLGLVAVGGTAWRRRSPRRAA